MELEEQREVEYLKRDLHQLEREEQELEHQLERVRATKQQIFDKIGGMIDTDYEKDALELLYQQRKKK